MITGECQCPERCGRDASRNGPDGTVYSEACYKRWVKYGRRAEGPPAPLALGERLERARHARDITDRYDEIWAAGEPERLINRARPRAAGLAAAVAEPRDVQGVARVLGKVATVEDLYALAVVLAECADPAKVAIVCGTTAAGEGRAA